jgi:hypothetical protein
MKDVIIPQPKKELERTESLFIENYVLVVCGESMACLQIQRVEQKRSYQTNVLFVDGIKHLAIFIE